MFDANMRHLKRKSVFFCLINGIKKKHDLYKLGVRRGRIIKCLMLDQEHNNPRVELEIDGEKIIIKGDFNFDIMATYVGHYIDGELSDFINDEHKEAAQKLIG